MTEPLEGEDAAEAFGSVMPGLLVMLSKEFAKLFDAEPKNIGIILLVNHRADGFIGTNYPEDGSLERAVRAFAKQLDDAQPMH